MLGKTPTEQNILQTGKDMLTLPRVNGIISANVDPVIHDSFDCRFAVGQLFSR